ncbi:MAG: hypothetical protein WAN65_16085 [Candidatus Sulfotelmatobacter sp.]
MTFNHHSAREWRAAGFKSRGPTYCPRCDAIVLRYTKPGFGVVYLDRDTYERHFLKCDVAVKAESEPKKFGVVNVPSTKQASLRFEQ